MMVIISVFLDNKVKGIHQEIKEEVDKLIRSGHSNEKIIKFLKDEKKVKEEILPTNRQLTDRRYHLKKVVLKHLKENTKGKFVNWFNLHKDFDKQNNDLICLSYILEENNFILLFTSKALLKNAILQAGVKGNSFIALDATHKVISCRFKLSTFATANLNQEIADICYMIHAHEDESSYLYGLKQIRKALKDIFNFDWDPNVHFIS